MLWADSCAMRLPFKTSTLGLRRALWAWKEWFRPRSGWCLVSPSGSVNLLAFSVKRESFLKFLLNKCDAFFGFFPPRVHKVKHFLNTELKAVVSQKKLVWVLKKKDVLRAHFIPTFLSPKKSFYFLYWNWSDFQAQCLKRSAEIIYFDYCAEGYEKS